MKGWWMEGEIDGQMEGWREGRMDRRRIGKECRHLWAYSSIQGWGTLKSPVN